MGSVSVNDRRVGAVTFFYVCSRFSRWQHEASLLQSAPMKFPALLISLAAATSIAFADDFEMRTFSASDGAKLPYRLLTPKNYDKAQKYPLVVFLHGAGERGDNNTSQLKHGAPMFAKPENREKYPCFVFAPQCPSRDTWSAVKGWTDPVSFTDEPKAPLKLAFAAIDALQKEYSIDPDRLYVTGLSMGGFGSWDIISRQPERWAAAAPVCGGGDPAKVVAAKNVAIWAMHGMQDEVVPVARSREMIDALKTAGASPLYSEYPYVKHDSWTTAYGEPELLPWMFAQRRGQIIPWEKIAEPMSQPPSSLFPGAGTTQSGLWFRNLWKGRRTQWQKDRDQDEGAIVFFGDSITQGWQTLARDFPNLKTANRGIGGDTTRGLRYRAKDDVIAVKPKAVSILIGTNDLDQGTEPEVVAENLKVIVADLLAANPKLPIVINKVMPRGARPGYFPDKIKKLNALYEAAFSGNPQITFCDTWTLFEVADGQCAKEEFPDMLHPNAEGYTKWKNALTPIFAKIGL
jgi:lysophospholipase L1-like esterase/dienelactone hydrolase